MATFISEQAIVLSTPEKKLYVVMDEQKQIIVVDLNKAGEQFKSFGEGMPKGPHGKSEPSKPPFWMRCSDSPKNWTVSRSRSSPA